MNLCIVKHSIQKIRAEMNTWSYTSSSLIRLIRNKFVPIYHGHTNQITKFLNILSIIARQYIAFLVQNDINYMWVPSMIHLYQSEIKSVNTQHTIKDVIKVGLCLMSCVVPFLGNFQFTCVCMCVCVIYFRHLKLIFIFI